MIIRDRDGSVRAERAGLVIGADGRRSSVAEAVRASSKFTGSFASAFVYGYFRDLPVAGYEWFYGPGVSAGAIPTNDGLICAFVGASPARLAALVEAGGPGHAVGVLAGECTLGERLRGATRVEGLRYMRGMPGYLRRSSGPGWALIGDAGYWKDPLSTAASSRRSSSVARAQVALAHVPKTMRWLTRSGCRTAYRTAIGPPCDMPKSANRSSPMVSTTVSRSCTQASSVKEPRGTSQSDKPDPRSS